MSDKKFSHIVQATRDMRDIAECSIEPEPSAPASLYTVDLALKEARIHDARYAVTSALKERIASLLQIRVDDIEEGKSVAAYGIDSLIAVELRSWLVATFQCVIPLLRLLDEGIHIATLVDGILEERKGLTSA
jgi:acyl carrier protein